MPDKEESKKARRRVIQYLSYRDRSQHEIACYLKEKGFSAKIADETLVFLEKNDYINDQRFAILFGRSRIEKKSVGRLRLEQELRIKGIEKETITKTLHSLYQEYDEKELAISCAKNKLSLFSPSDTEKERGRLARFLERKGFAFSLVYQVVNQLVPRDSKKNVFSSLPLAGKLYQKTTSSLGQD